MNWRGDNLALHVFGASHSEVIAVQLPEYDGDTGVWLCDRVEG